MNGHVTHSTKCNRVYPRKFDWDEARRLRAGGWTYRALADKFGVSPASVRRVCDPVVYEQMRVASNDWIKQNMRALCVGGCGTLVWTVNRDRSGLCVSCYTAQLTAPDERSGELRCTKCSDWKPDGAFRAEERQTRRGRHSQCRACETAERVAWREAHRDHERAYDRERKRKARPA